MNFGHLQLLTSLDLICGGAVCDVMISVLWIKQVEFRPKFGLRGRLQDFS